MKKKKIYLEVVIFVNILSLIIVFLLQPEQFSFFENISIQYFSYIFFINLLLYFFIVKKYLSNWFRYDVLFLTGFLIVHFQIPYFASLGFEPIDGNKIWINKNVVNYAVWLSTVCGLIWMLGFLIFLQKQKKMPSKLSESINIPLVKTLTIDTLILILFLIFLSLVGNEFLSGAYDGVRNWGSGATYIYILLSASVKLRTIYMFTNAYTRNKINFVHLLSRNKFFLLILIPYLLIFLLSSDRGEILTIGIIIVGSYSLLKKEISFNKIVLMIFLGGVFLSILQLGRTGKVNVANSDKNVIERGINNLSSIDKFNPTYELATSQQNLNRALNTIPDKRPYLLGLTHFSNLVSVLPLLGSEIIESLGIPFQYTSSTTLFSFWDQGVNIKSGVGSEIVADNYINYGIYGTFFIFILFGYFIGYLQMKVYLNPSFILLIVYLVFLSDSLYMNRAVLFQPLKTLFYILLFHFFFVRLFKLSKHKL